MKAVVVYCRPGTDDMQVKICDDLEEAQAFVAHEYPFQDEEDISDCKTIIVKQVGGCRTEPTSLDVEYPT